MQRQNSFQSLEITDAQAQEASSACGDELDMLLGFELAQAEEQCSSRAATDIDEKLALFPSQRRSQRILEKFAAACSDLRTPPPPMKFTRTKRRSAA